MTHTVEIDQKQEVVFDYIAQLEKHGEWQPAILKSNKEPAGTTRLGTRNTENRKMPGGIKDITSEVIEYDPPKRISAKTVSKSPIIATIVILLEPVKNGQATIVNFQLTLKGIGFGKLFVPLARKNSQQEIPKDLQRLKTRLEHTN